MEQMIGTISTLTLLVGALTTLFLKIIDSKKKIKDSIPKKVLKQCDINTKIIEKMKYLREILGADRIQIYDFHNGEHYANGRSALKISCTYEVARAGIKPCQNEFQSVPISCIPIFVQELINKNDMEIKSLERIKNVMPGTYNLKKTQGIKSYYDIVIKNKEKEPIGFLGVQYTTKEKEKYTLDEKNEILKLKFFIEDHLDKMK